MDDAMKGCLLLYCVLLLGTVTKAIHYPVPKEYQARDWMKVGQDELKRTLGTTINTNAAKNVILFVGDGMGFTTVWASRIYTGQQKYGQSGEEYEMEFEKFSHVGLSKTYNVESQVPDSSATATAFLSGVKTNSRTVGVSEKVQYQNCSNENQEQLENIVDWSLAKGKSVGIVTTTTVTHGTPAAMYAHSANRDWETDSDLNDPSLGDPEYNRQFNCRDIARQLIEDGADINVILGGGLEKFLPKDEDHAEYDHTEGERSDKRNLIDDWLAEKKQRISRHAFVYNREQLQKVDADNTDYLLGLFNPSHMQFELYRNKTREPSLAEMTEKAIKVLQKNQNGFFLLVEGGRIDHGHHLGYARLALHETLAFDEAITAALGMINKDETLTVVTADHSHSFTTSGYSTRGNDILGTVDRHYFGPATDGLPILTLTYANGPGAPYNSSFGRSNLTGVDTTSGTFKQDAIAPVKYETHGGEDVPIYANGPMAHLFDGVHEQNYIAHVMAYASCVGPNTEHCASQSTFTGAGSSNTISLLTVLSVVVIAHAM